MAQNDLLEQVSANGPFSQQLQPPTYQASQQQGSGFQGTTGNVAQIADKFLEGLSRGRAAAYNRSMQEKQQTLTAVSAQIQQLQDSELPPEIKSQKLAELNDIRGHVFLNALDDGKGGSSKGKKGGGQSGGDGDHPGGHILNAVKSMVTGMLGPGRQPGNIDPKELQEKMSQTSQLIGQAPQIAAQHLNQQITSVNQALAPLVKSSGDQMPTFSKAMSDPGFVSTLAKTIRPDGTYPPPIQNTIDAMKSREKEQADLAKETAKDTAAANRAHDTQEALDKRAAANKTADLARQNKRDEDLDKRQTVRDKIDAQYKGAEANRANAEAGLANQKRADLKADASANRASNTSLSNGKSLENNAWDFISTKSIDTKGLGKEAHRDTQAIMDRVGKIQEELNIGPGDVAAIRAGTKADTSALVKLNTTAQQVSGFEGVLNRNLDTLLKLDKANPRYDIQFANRVQQAFKTGKGDPEALNMAAQLHGTSREWAKIMAGNMSAAGVPISEAKDADEILNRAMSSGQINSLVKNVIRVDAKNRSDENSHQLDTVRKRLRTFQGYKPDTERGVEAEGGAPPNQRTAGAPPQAAAGAPPQQAAQQGGTPPQAAQQQGAPPANRPSLDDIFKKKK